MMEVREDDDEPVIEKILDMKKDPATELRSHWSSGATGPRERRLGNALQEYLKTFERN
jgi:hypothetical protein